MFDFFFYYKYVIRFILFLKKSKAKFKSMDILKLEKAIVFFDLKNITDINNLSISNYYFFFNYFFVKLLFFFIFNIIFIYIFFFYFFFFFFYFFNYYNF